MEAVIFTGIQATGKSTFYCQRFLHSHLRLARDAGGLGLVAQGPQAPLRPGAGYGAGSAVLPPADRQQLDATGGTDRTGHGRSAGAVAALKHLRKTAAQLVREVSNGEVAAVFLSHGQPVRGDELSDLYSRQPFDKVAQALGQVHNRLGPVFAAVDDAFTSTPIGGRGPRKREGASPT